MLFIKLKYSIKILKENSLKPAHPDDEILFLAVQYQKIKYEKAIVKH